MMNDMVKRELEKNRVWFEDHLNSLCSSRPENIPPRLWESMTYSLQAGGKRLRPILCVKAAESVGGEKEKVLPMALALEMVHTASLIHDDLPAMDNDSLRRGKPTNHMIYGDALAILAGDALLAWAFEYSLKGLMDRGVPPSSIVQALSIFAQAVGPSGICCVQVLDTDPASFTSSLSFVANIALQKTAVLLQASLVTGAILGGASQEIAGAFGKYGRHLGLAFQIVDDILDVTSSPEELGKTPGKDAAQQKITFVTQFGLEEARKMALKESKEAAESLFMLGSSAVFFQKLALSLSKRSR